MKRIESEGGGTLSVVLTIAFVATLGLFLSTTLACQGTLTLGGDSQTVPGEIKTVSDLEKAITNLEKDVDAADDKTMDAYRTIWLSSISKFETQVDRFSSEVSDATVKDWRKRLNALKDKLNKTETPDNKDKKETKISKEPPSSTDNAVELAPGGTAQPPAPQRVLGWQGGATVNYDNSLLRLDLIVNGERIDAREVSARTLKLVDVWSVDVQAVPSDSRVSVSGTGTQNLSEGPNTFGVTTTAPNGTTWYFAFNITVERAPAPPEKSHDATLASLGIFYGGQDESRRLSPAFSSGIFSYTLASEAWLGNFVFSPAPAHTGATFSSNVEGDRYTCTVTAEDGTTTNTYTITRTPPTPAG